MVTALNEPSDFERGVQAGTDDFLTKPVNKVELLCRIRSLLRVRHLKSQLDRTLAYLAEVESSSRVANRPGPTPLSASAVSARNAIDGHQPASGRDQAATGPPVLRPPPLGLRQLDRSRRGRPRAGRRGPRLQLRRAVHRPGVVQPPERHPGPPLPLGRRTDRRGLPGRPCWTRPSGSGRDARPGRSRLGLPARFQRRGRHLGLDGRSLRPLPRRSRSRAWPSTGTATSWSTAWSSGPGPPG